jgi:hypothetical protein
VPTLSKEVANSKVLKQSDMEPIIKSTGKNVAGSKRKGGEPSDRIHSSSVPKAAHALAQRIDEQSRSVMMGSATLEPSPNHFPPTSRSQPSQQRPPPAACNAAEETVIRSPEGAYIPPLSAREMDYHRVTNSLKNAAYTAAVDHHNIPSLEPQSEYLPQATAYPGVNGLPSTGQYPSTQQPQLRQPPFYQPSVQQPSVQLSGGDALPPTGQYPPTQQPQSRQPPFYQPFVQQPSFQLPMYNNIGYTMYPPPLQSTYQSMQWASAVSSFPTVDQHYSTLSMPVDSAWLGPLGLQSRIGAESDTTSRSTPSSHTPSLADTSRKLDAILGKRADQRTEEENRFREEHLAARQIEHARDAADLKRRRLSDRKKKKKALSRTEESS